MVLSLLCLSMLSLGKEWQKRLGENSDAEVVAPLQKPTGGPTGKKNPDIFCARSAFAEAAQFDAFSISFNHWCITVYPFHCRFVHEGDGVFTVDLEEFTVQRKGTMEAAMDRSDGSFSGRAGCCVETRPWCFQHCLANRPWLHG